MAASKAAVGVLSIGQMGFGFAKLLLAHGFHVITNVGDRSPATQERAKSASIECVSSDSELVAKADYILSIVPPMDAKATAERVLSVFTLEADPRPGKKESLYYADLNAVSPETARNISALFKQERRVIFIDGGIIGGPPAPTTDTVDWKRPGIPMSGPHPLHDAPIAGRELADTLNARYLNADIGTASGLKCTFAALSKGFTALALQSFTTAESLGVLPQLQDYISEYNPSAKARAEKGITGCPPKAYRWVEEMNQIGQCFEMDGGWPNSANVFRNVARVYEQLAVAVEERGGVEGMDDLSGALSALTKSLKDGDDQS
ncbi:6-phosphogluconate dehydrogenase C-terminal domain-like protein [Karstenula rhodostoma CBS 690.94]|uniref:6-phosphogluconate dehydrogenase C-terminal domain-like protein n=1 Tax=Karstenula rhodostoma CBS 690.94 TaxID=1392251 RepID=A0A9P4P970_9PLEO|nr:6-phosphogluconate dehydrogenase C-terminal domain-like protein [Karstenula rhodostoma CBS 690.94]